MARSSDRCCRPAPHRSNRGRTRRRTCCCSGSSACPSRARGPGRNPSRCRDPPSAARCHPGPCRATRNPSRSADPRGSAARYRAAAVPAVRRADARQQAGHLDHQVHPACRAGGRRWRAGPTRFTAVFWMYSTTCSVVAPGPGGGTLTRGSLASGAPRPSLFTGALAAALAAVALAPGFAAPSSLAQAAMLNATSAASPARATRSILLLTGLNPRSKLGRCRCSNGRQM